MPINIMTGTDSDDRLNATNRRDQISLLAGDDWQVLVGGRDTVYGGDGSDTVFGYFGGDQIFGGDGDDELVSSTGAGEAPSLLDGGSGNDRIFAGDVLADAYGGDGDDTITVYFGQGGMAQGGAGMDLLVLAAIGPLGDSLPAVADVTVILTGPGAGATAGAFALDFSGFEALGVTTSYGNDTVRGGDLDDVIDVDAGANDVQALGGNDVVTYRTGEANLLDGGEGVDQLVVFGLFQSGDLRFYADDGDDGFGATFTGFERYFILGGSGDDYAVLGAGADNFLGFTGRDSVFGMAGRDRLEGEQGADRLDGGRGRDILHGGSGVDRLIGGGNADSFVFRLVSDMGDIIVDFTSGVDVIRIESGLFAGLSQGAPAEGQFALDQAQGTQGQFVFHMAGEAAHRDLYWDANGTDAGGEVLIARLDPGAVLVATDLLLV